MVDHGAKQKKCPACSGSGQKIVVDMFNRPARVICGDCSGSGSILRAKDNCKKCKGTKLTEEKKLLEFWIDRGMEDGDRIVIKGEADQEPGKETGDVIFVLREKDHPVFTRMGPDLKATLNITLEEALCGFSRVILTTLDGRGLKYTHKVTGGKVIRPKEIFKIVGEGMPIGKKSDEKGDLYLDVDIEFPQDGWIADPVKIDLLRSFCLQSQLEITRMASPKSLTMLNWKWQIQMILVVKMELVGKQRVMGKVMVFLSNVRLSKLLLVYLVSLEFAAYYAYRCGSR